MKMNFFLAAILFLAISLHTIHFDHDHPREIFGDEPQAIMHGGDKKWFGDVLVPLIVTPFIILLRSPVALPVVFFVFLFYKFFDPLQEALRRGILHSKIYA